MSLIPLYTQPYNEVVQPDVVWTVSKYFIRRWPAYLAPNELWLVVGARQLSYYNNKADWFDAYDRKLANEAKVSLSLYQHQMKPQILEGEGALSKFLSIRKRPTYERQGEVTRQTETTYQIRRDDPLTPADAAYLGDWLRRNAPSRVTPQSIKSLLEDAYKVPSREFWSPTPTLPATHSSLSVADVVEYIFGTDIRNSKDREWQSAADALHQHITEAQTLYIDTQYFRQTWLPKLKHGPAWLMVFLRSFTYRDSEGNVRDLVDYYANDVQQLFNVKDAKTMRSWLRKLQKAVPERDRQPFPDLVKVLEKQKEADGRLKRVLQVTIDDPLTAKDLKTYWGKVEKLQEGKKDSHEIEGDGEFSSHTIVTKGKISGHAIVPERKNNSDTSDSKGKKDSHEIDAKGNINSDSNPLPRKFYSDTPPSEGKNSSTWEEKLQANKYYKQFFSLTGNKNTLIKTISTVAKPSLWKIESERADFAFAVVAVADLRDFLSIMEIVDQRGAGVIRRSGWSAVQAVAWYLWGTDQSWMKNLGGYMIQRARERQAPPADYEALAELPWALWRIYALYWQMPIWLRPTREQMEPLPMFEAWSLIYADRPTETLPFEVGRDLKALADALAKQEPPQKQKIQSKPTNGASQTAVGKSGIAGATQEAENRYAELWQAALSELELQMTRATFDAWLRHTNFARYDAGTYHVTVQNQRAKEWLDARLKQMVERTLSTLTGETVKLSVKVEAE
ncbi:MAG: hypothetical protein KDE51_01210 [Anaerolineales bacterium]|nr:hypothetical protein [Anaerolineales bacterium]